MHVNLITYVADKMSLNIKHKWYVVSWSIQTQTVKNTVWILQDTMDGFHNRMLVYGI